LSTFHRLLTVHYDLSTAGTPLASLKFINEARLTVIVDMTAPVDLTTRYTTPDTIVDNRSHFGIR